jgi:three-Cys-motif partner protein
MISEAFEFDRIGYWSEIKLDIIREYASAYSRILSAQKNPSLHHIYIDAFAGAGVHVSRSTKGFVAGSPLNALNVQPQFDAYHLIDIKEGKIENLRQMIGPRQDVFLYRGDCNTILLDKIFPRVTYEKYMRGLCILDPYGLQVNWTVIARAGQLKTLDVFLNFPVADMNRNVLWRDPHDVNDLQKARLTAFWGDDSWRDVAYRPDLLGNPGKQSNTIIAEAFRKRLKQTAGFARVPKPIPMRNSKGAIVYYLFFASQKNTAENIVLDIFRKYEKQGES